ncbi:MAG TPA: SMI1/KNR4 family protein [Pyrinomonadaceae bacterium]|jgi:hypothetical protein
MKETPFENVKIVDPYVERGWTPELKLMLATPEEVDALEAKLNLTFPEGYREFVTTFGKGDYCGHNTAIRVDMPSAISSEYKEHQEFLDEFWFWEDSEDLLPKEKAVECIRVCDTDVGDVIIFHSSSPNELFVLPHSDDIAYRIGSNLYEAFDWLVAKGSQAAGGTEESLKWRVFVPDNPFAYSNGVIRPDGFYK